MGMMHLKISYPLTTMNHRDHTIKPGFYDNIYWGNFSGAPHDQILINRDSFIASSGIERSRPRRMRWESGDLNYARNNYRIDHIELYEGRDGENYQVCSQHPGSLRISEDEMQREGWSKIRPIYAMDQISWMRKVDEEKIKGRTYIRETLPILPSSDLEDDYVPRLVRTRRKISKIKEIWELLGYRYLPM
jgi:hypothetical protein